MLINDTYVVSIYRRDVDVSRHQMQQPVWFLGEFASLYNFDKHLLHTYRDWDL